MSPASRMGRPGKRSGERDGERVWKKFTHLITGVTTSTTIAFINADPSNDTNDGLDAVKLVPAG